MADNHEQIYIRPRRGTKSTMYETAKSAMVLKEGEIFIEVPDEGVGKGASKVKIGDGVSAYAALPYALGDTDSIEFFEERSNDAQALINQIVTGVSLSKFTANAKRVMQLLLNKFSNYLPISGGTINGNLTVNGGITSQDDTSRTVSVKTDSLGATTLKTKNTQSTDVEIVLPDRSGTLALAGDVPSTIDTYDPTSPLPTSGKAVKDALDTLDVTGASNIAASKTIKSWSETDGKVNITTQNISITKSQITDFPALSTVASTGQYNDLYGTPQLATVATSGSYEDLSGKPTIPSVGNAKLTIKKNNSEVGSFTANATSNVAVNITVPTTLSELSADSTHRLVTDSQISTWNSKQAALTQGTNISISNNTISAVDSKVDMNITSANTLYNILLAPFTGYQSKTSQKALQRATVAANVWHQDVSGWSSKRPSIGEGMVQLSGTHDTHGYYGGNAWYFGESELAPTGGMGLYYNPTNTGDRWGLAMFATGDHGYYIKYGVQYIDNNSTGRWGFVPYAAGGNSIFLGAPNTYEGAATCRWGKLYTVSAPDTGSDRRLKQDIVYYEDEDIKDFIMDLKPVHFKWKGDIDPQHRVHYGFIAQDVEESMIKFGLTEEDFGALGKWQKSEAVTKTRINHNEETGEDVEEEYTDYELIDDYEYSLTYEEFISPLIKMVQIQQREIDELKARVAELENN